MSNVKVICLGEILVDKLADQLGKSPAQVQTWTDYPGGAPANVACALTKLGTKSAFIGSVGNDSIGQNLIQLLSDIGVITHGIQIHPTAPTRQVYVTRSYSGDRNFAGFGNQPADQFADAFLDEIKLPTQLFLSAEFLVLGTLELAYNQTQKAVFQAIKLAQKNNLKIILDINWRPMFWQNIDQAIPLIKEVIKSVHFLKLAKEEAQLLFNTENAAQIYHKLGDIEGVLITAGGEGNVNYCMNEFFGEIPPFNVKSVDTTGAGDAFVAGFIHQLVTKGMKILDDKQQIEQMIIYACAVGALTTLSPGAIASQPTPVQVDQFLQKTFR
ncbi:MAG TPA: carbohydrate kinase [Allocoleopsis sp.]